MKKTRVVSKIQKLALASRCDGWTADAVLRFFCRFRFSKIAFEIVNCIPLKDFRDFALISAYPNFKVVYLVLALRKYHFKRAAKIMITIINFAL